MGIEGLERFDLRFDQADAVLVAEEYGIFSFEAFGHAGFEAVEDVVEG